MSKGFMLVLAGSLGVLAFILVLRHANRKEREMRADYENKYGKLCTVYVAARNIPGGEPVGEKDYQQELVPFKAVQPDAVTTVERFEGKIATVPIPKGGQILGTKLQLGSGYRLAFQIDTNDTLRALTLALSGDASLAGMLEPQDLVDVIGVFESQGNSPDGDRYNHAKVLVEARRVLAVGQRMQRRTGSRDEDRQGAGSMVTIEVTAEEARELSLAAAVGSLRCVLRGVQNIVRHEYRDDWVRSDKLNAKGKLIIPEGMQEEGVRE
jgi:Flp pilus assembly protein CpaB